MKKILLFLAIVLLVSCKSSTIIVTNEPATVYDKRGNVLGVTPYKHTDRKPSFSKTHFTLKTETAVLDTFIVKKGRVHAGAIVGAVLTGYGTFWLVQYKKNINFNIQENGK
jgi:hypothetical protein